MYSTSCCLAFIRLTKIDHIFTSCDRPSAGCTSSARAMKTVTLRCGTKLKHPVRRVVESNTPVFGSSRILTKTMHVFVFVLPVLLYSSPFKDPGCHISSRLLKAVQQSQTSGRSLFCRTHALSVTFNFCLSFQERTRVCSSAPFPGRQSAAAWGSSRSSSHWAATASCCSSPHLQVRNGTKKRPLTHFHRGNVSDILCVEPE